MKTSKALLLTMLGMGAVITACSHHSDDDPTGSWTSAAPINVTETVDGSTAASKVISIDFKAPVADAAGVVTLTADYDVTVPDVTDPATDSHSYQVTATITGTWTQDKDDHDDYLLAFDTNTLSVAGTNAPELGPVTDDFLTSLSSFTKIEDVEVSKDGTHMTFETDHPDVKYHFARK